jgi:signal peptidase II
MNQETKRRLLLLVVIAVPVILIDQLTKYWVIRDLTLGVSGAFTRFWSQEHPLAVQPHVVIGDLWSFQYVENPGAAWGLLAGVSETFRAPFFLLVSIGAMVMILYYLFKSPPQLRMRMVALSLVFGGAIGNFLDRVRLRYVIDFIDWHYKDAYHWPTFNVADAAISVGVVLLLLESFFYPEVKAVKATAPTN